LDIDSAQSAVNLVVAKAISGKRIFTCGNGGSASTASHYITDWNKMANLATGKPFRGICLSDNMGLVTAYGNDISYEEVFAGQIKSLADSGDLLVVVSGSGNSPNILRAIKTARDFGLSVVGVLGYDGGKAKDMCDEVFHAVTWDMQIAEDIHLSFGHMVMKSICKDDIHYS
ncbi:MAG: SIS domain-containing protein, partial [Balneolaceae bacterium]|nr:SIS domain-containing protein [Balneolaceae bacterium]